jgi:chemotaxis protein MotB
MMAFFLMLWLLNVSTDDALAVISSYFDPSHPKVSRMESGAGGVMGGLTMSAQGSMAQNRQMPIPPQNTGARQAGQADSRDSAIKKLEEALREKERQDFEEAKKKLEEALSSDPNLQELARHVLIDITNEGLRIQIIDQEGRPMFASGSADMLPAMRRLMGEVSTLIDKMPNDLSIRGHTDGIPYPAGATYTNWELSADRANAARRGLIARNVAPDRLGNVMGKADREHLFDDDPRDARNRRISIILMNESLDNALARGALDDQMIDEQTRQQIESGSYLDALEGATNDPGFQQTPGEVFFP